MVDHKIVDGTEVGIKIYLTLAFTTEPHFLNLSNALTKAAQNSGCRVSFEEGRKIAVGDIGEIKGCTKAVFFPLNRQAAQNKDSMQKLQIIAEEVLKLDRILIQQVVAVQVVQVKTEETGGEILTLQTKQKASQ